jgi:regulator of sirC expression with transglutaminase-like and TPR domain
MKKLELRQIIREEVKSALTEATPQEQKVNRILNNIAKEYQYSTKDAAFFLVSTLKRLGYIKDFKI